MKAFLESIDQPGQQIRLTKRVSVVGRLPDSDVRIDHVSLSRRHAVLVMAEGLVVVRDLITTNGTKVNGKKVHWAALMPNDTIAFGSQKFRIVYGPDTKLEMDWKKVLPNPETPDMLGNYSELFRTSEPSILQNDKKPSAIRPNLVVEESLSDLEFEDSQNTEVGGWKPGKE